jgi:hypothetical protein
VKVRALFPLAVTAGLCFGEPVAAQQPTASGVKPVAVANPNQVLADNIAYRLRAMNSLEGAEINITAQDGIVTLTGTTRDAGQKAAILKNVQTVSGVVLVRDGLRVGSVVQAQDANPVPMPPMPLAPTGGPPVNGNNPIVEPAPLGIPGQMAPDMMAPNLPPYAWPTYAPYNNLSRVAYPTAYPYNAFPFIGPFYPFPKVPLGWRKVTLEWDDGHWYLGRNSAPHDYWRVRFW